MTAAAAPHNLPMQRTGGNGIFKSASRCAPAADRSHVMRYSVSAGYGAAAGASPASDERRRYTPFMPDDTVRTVYVQQQQVPGGWQDHAETEDRAIATARYKSFAPSPAAFSCALADSFDEFTRMWKLPEPPR